MSKESCESCKFWFSKEHTTHTNDTIYLYNVCRYNPPTVVPIGDDDTTSSYPFVNKTNWCGRYLKNK